MRKLAIALFGFGVFLAFLAPAMGWYLEPRLIMIPRNYSKTVEITGEGRAMDTKKGLTDVKIEGYLEVKVAAASATDAAMTMWTTINRISPTGEKAPTLRIEHAAINRRTGLARSSSDEHVDAIPVQHKGLVFTFPFDTPQRDHEFWDATTQRAWPARYAGEDTIEGLRVYKFDVRVPKTTARFKLDKESVSGSYQSDRTLWVEPTTGIIVRASDQQKQWWDAKSPETGETLVFEGTIGYTDASVKNTVKTARESMSQIAMVRSTLPITFGVLGVVSILGGIVLLVLDSRRRRSNGAHAADQPD